MSLFSHKHSKWNNKKANHYIRDRRESKITSVPKIYFILEVVLATQILRLAYVLMAILFGHDTSVFLTVIAGILAASFIITSSIPRLKDTLHRQKLYK